MTPNQNSPTIDRPACAKEMTYMLGLRLTLSVIGFAVASPPVVAGDTKSLCSDEEIVYLSCDINGKTLSVCGSKNLTAVTGYLKYSYGVRNKIPEMVYPATNEHPSKVFRRNEPLVAAKAGVMALAFDVSAFTYNVFSTRSAFGYNGAGVIVQKEGREISRKECSRSSINDNDFFFELGDVGMPVGDVLYIGPEQ